MSIRITIRDKEYLSKRIQEEYGPLSRRLYDALIPIRTSTRNELLETLGINHIEEAISSLHDQIKELKRQRDEVMGIGKANSPFERRVDDAVRARPEAQALRLVKSHIKKAQDTVMVAGFPDDMKVFLEALPAQINALTVEVKQLTNGDKA